MVSDAPALRVATRADLETIAALEARCFGPRDGAFSRRQLSTLLANPRALWLLAAEDLGVACWLRASNGRARWARLYSLAVDPAARRRGLGEALVLAGIARLRAEGFQRFTAECLADNAPARRLYAGLGFEEAGPLPDYYGPGLDGLRLRLSR